MKFSILDRKPEPATSTWEGKTTNTMKQWCLIEIDGLPSAFQITHRPIPDGNGGERFDLLPAGPAELSSTSFSVQNGRLQMTNAKLIPIAKSVNQPKV